MSFKSALSPLDCMSAWQEEKEHSVLWNKPLRQLRLSAIACLNTKWERQSFLTHWQQCEKWMWLAVWCTPRKQWGYETSRREREKKKTWQTLLAVHIFTCTGLRVWEQTAQRLLCHLMCCKVKLQLLVLSADGNTCCLESELGAHFINYETLLWMYWHLHFELFLYSVLQVCAHVSSLFIWLFKVLFSFIESDLQ